MKNIYKILIGMAAACVLMVVLDWAVGTWSEKMYYKSKYGMFHRQIYCLQESKDDILILGSSRAAHHYVPQIFEDSLGMSCYNAGSDGECIYYHYAILAARCFRKCPPKLVILEVMGLDVTVSNTGSFSLADALDRLAPHYGEVPAIDSLFYLNGWKERVKLCSKTYRYNSKMVQTIKCNYLPSPEDKGYEALDGVLEIKDGKAADVLTSSSEPDIEERKVVYVRKLIDLCRKNNIELVMCFSPYYNSSMPQSVSLLKDIAAEEGVPFFDYYSSEEYQRPEYFKDASHLNDTGARLYSREIAHRIKTF